MELSSCGAQLIAEFEGYSSTAYWDADGGVWTIGYGTTGSHAYPGATTNREQALEWLREEADGKDSPGINRLGLNLSQAKHDALVSFSYNLGPGVIGDPGSSIGSALRERRFSDVPAALALYDKADGHVLLGLIRRRAREGRLFANGDYGFDCIPTEEDDMPYTEAQLREIVRSEIEATVPTLVDAQLDQHGLGKGEPDPAWMDRLVTRIKG